MRSGTTRSSSSYSRASKITSGPVAFSQTVPAEVGTLSTVDHGRRWDCSISPVREMPASASRSSSHEVASCFQLPDDQTATP